MRKLLQIGEAAQLLGVTTKALRHYHKVGLLQEPERTEAGYRLYDAQDLLRLKQIRHMQAFGLPLKHIKTILGDAARKHTLRDILQALDTELASQVQVLEERRARIRSILDENKSESESESEGINALAKIDQPATLASFEIVKELVGERLARLSPATLEIEKQFWTIIEGFDWPDDYRAHMLQVARDIAAHPELFEGLFAFNEKLAALSVLSADAPEVDQLIAEYAQNKELQRLLAEMAMFVAHLPQLASPFAEMFGNLISANVSPVQQRLLAQVERWQSVSKD